MGTDQSSAQPPGVRRVPGPADPHSHRQGLIRTAQAAGASDDVIAALRAIPPEEYTNRAEVARPVPANLASNLGLSPGHQAQQARQVRRHGPRRVSQYQRDAPKQALDGLAGAARRHQRRAGSRDRREARQGKADSTYPAASSYPAE